MTINFICHLRLPGNSRNMRVDHGVYEGVYHGVNHESDRCAKCVGPVNFTFFISMYPMASYM